MKCALCRLNEADKKNTHYLTDSIIRSCLNQDGINQREKGFYFEMGSDSPFVEFNFQRETSIEKISESLERYPTDIEIEKAKRIPFSIDNVFCSECEKKFSEIEGHFTRRYLPHFRERLISEIDLIVFNEVRLLRQFFLLQIWRTNVCETIYDLPPHVSEELRIYLNAPKDIDIKTILKYPLSITYLETANDTKNYTTNFVGFTNDKNPYIILMNDFIIQFFDSKENITFNKFYGLNNELNFKETINLEENEFKISIMHDEKRLAFLQEFHHHETAQRNIQYLASFFVRIWRMAFKAEPPLEYIQEYLGAISKNDSSIVKYSKERIIRVTNNFIRQKMKS